MLKIGILASHQGTGFQAVVDACSSGVVQASVELLICNNSSAGVMARAAAANVPALHLSQATHPGPGELDAAICQALLDAEVDLVVLVGYMKRLGLPTVNAFEGRVISVHPSLLPKHGGPGFYGGMVHEAVLKAGDTETGATLHLVSEMYDEGDILLQESMTVEPGDTVASLTERLKPIEHGLIIEAITRFAEGKF